MSSHRAKSLQLSLLPFSQGSNFSFGIFEPLNFTWKNLFFFPWLIFPFQNKRSFKWLHSHQEKYFQVLSNLKNRKCSKIKPIGKATKSCSLGWEMGRWGRERNIGTPSKDFPSGKGSTLGYLENHGHRKCEFFKNKQTNQITKEKLHYYPQWSEWNHMCLWVSRAALGLFFACWPILPSLNSEQASQAEPHCRPPSQSLGATSSFVLLIRVPSHPGNSFTTRPVGWAFSPTCRWVVSLSVRLKSQQRKLWVRSRIWSRNGRSQMMGF